MLVSNNLRAIHSSLLHFRAARNQLRLFVSGVSGIWTMAIASSAVHLTHPAFDSPGLWRAEKAYRNNYDGLLLMKWLKAAVLHLDVIGIPDLFLLTAVAFSLNHKVKN